MVPGKNFRDPFASLFASANVRRLVVLTVPSYSSAAEVVAATDLVTMLPSSLLAAKGPSLGLQALVSALPPHVTKLTMSWHERTHSDPAARAFRALVRGLVAEPGPARGLKRLRT
jgi:DNA-binding transcriptional LysR family regulator